MMQRCLLALVSVLVLVAAPARLGAADLATARTLYASASYDEALAMLATIETPENIEPVNQMRALCLMALGRNREAEESIERIILHNPSYVIEEGEVSPKVVSLFRSVRQRTLPTVARALYAQAKASFDNQRWDAAANEFARMLAIVGDPDLANQRASLNDLRQLGEGFRKLSEAELAALAAKTPAPPAATTAGSPTVANGATTQNTAPTVTPAEPTRRPVAPPSNPAPPAPTVPAGQPAERPGLTTLSAAIYTAQSQDVVPPVELQRPMPRWSPVNRLIAQATYRGLIEIVIDERGAVEAATMAKSVTPMYDDLLLQSARSWRYTPAKKDGKPVRYRQVLEIVLQPSR